MSVRTRTRTRTRRTDLSGEEPVIAVELDGETGGRLAELFHDGAGEAVVVVHRGRHRGAGGGHTCSGGQGQGQGNSGSCQGAGRDETRGRPSRDTHPPRG